MAKAETVLEAEAAAAVTAEVDAAGEAAAPVAKRSKVKLFAIGGLALTLGLGGGGYFAVPMALAMFAPAEGGAAVAATGEEKPSEEASAGGGHGGAAAVHAQPGLPVIKLVLPEATATDYQIVSIFEGEAFLATSDAVIRIRVGSKAPGLGDILAIEPSDSGGVVTGTLATLKTS